MKKKNTTLSLDEQFDELLNDFILGYMTDPFDMSNSTRTQGNIRQFVDGLIEQLEESAKPKASNPTT